MARAGPRPLGRVTACEIHAAPGHAARLLRDTGVPVTDVCFASGFGGVPSFHSAFRAAYGMTPSAYRAAPFVAR